MRTRALISALPVFGLALVPCLASATALRLLSPYLDGTYHYAVGIADNGTVIGNAQDFWGSVPVVWSRGAETYAPAVPPPLPAGAEAGELRWIAPDASLLAGYAALPMTDTGENDQVNHQRHRRERQRRREKQGDGDRRHHRQPAPAGGDQRRQKRRARP